MKDAPFHNADLNIFVDGSSFMVNGKQKAGYAIVTQEAELEAEALPPNTSAQKAEVIALICALELAGGKIVNIWTDFKFVFGIVHAHAAIWKERGLLISQGSPVKYGEWIQKLL